jgi:DNA mismatch endonuclease (patch repair protein)
MDRLTTEHRSWNMSRIRGSDTGPERAVRSILHRLGCRFRLRARSLPGSPDVVLSRHGTVVFVHGCFWHRHRSCPYTYTPKTRKEFWSRKFDANVERDRRVTGELRALGWRVLVVWECELRDSGKLSRRLERELRQNKDLAVQKRGENT